MSLILGLCGSLVVLGAAPQRDSFVASDLERYAKGEFDAAIEDLVRDRGMRDAVNAFRREGSDWLSRSSADTRETRRRVVTAVALELVARGVDGLNEDYDAARGLVEWSCELLRRERPSEFERLFHLASVALLQAARDETVLVGLMGGAAARRYHVFHGASRFPAESRLELAWITTRIETQIIASRPLAPGYLRSSWDPTDSTAVTSLQETLRDLGLLVADPQVGHEAKLRRGVLTFLMAQPAAAVMDLRDAAQSPEPFIRYLAHVMLGLTYERTGRVVDAIGEYRAAVRTVPASAATLALASALARQGQKAEAGEVLTAWMAAPRPEDPWRLYNQRDYRLFPGHLRQLRALVLR